MTRRIAGHWMGFVPSQKNRVGWQSHHHHYHRISLSFFFSIHSRPHVGIEVNCGCQDLHPPCKRAVVQISCLLFMNKQLRYFSRFFYIYYYKLMTAFLEGRRSSKNLVRNEQGTDQAAAQVKQKKKCT